MESKSINTPLIVIAGETASGKTALALAMAQQFNGEIICADSRTVYRGMDIGSAKPGLAEQCLVKHYLLDISTVDKPINVSDFKILATKAIADITSRKKIPFLVGGSGLYIDAILFDYAFSGGPDFELRKQLEELSVEDLQAMLSAKGIPLPNNARNPRHLIRRIETGGAVRLSTRIRPDSLVIGLQLSKEELDRRIEKRTHAMMSSGIEAEARLLSQQYGWKYPSMQTIGYQEFEPYLRGESTLEEVETKITRHTIQYAKRQRTWFKRRSYMNYICNETEAVDLITSFLNK
jgi:tRNA dimethylallyltransferase